MGWVWLGGGILGAVVILGAVALLLAWLDGQAR